MNSASKGRKLLDILSEKQLKCIINQNLKTGFHLLKYELKSATEGMSGFLGDHFKITLHLKEGDSVKQMYLFVKTMPRVNGPKAEFINEYNFFKRESLCFKIFENLPDEEFSDSMPWGVKALIHDDNILVLPDLSVEGYKTYPATQYLDLDHVLATLKSMARFHAAFAKHQTHASEADCNNYKSPEEYACFLQDPQFSDCAWLRAGIKTASNFLKQFSSNIKNYPMDLEDSMTKWCIDACDRLTDHENTLNVIIHKDLWANNIMFKYSGNDPINAVLIDFQCVRYAPAAIDVMVFLYYTTSRKFREHYEKEVLNHYYSVFAESIDERTRRRLDSLKYDRQAFFDMCEELRPAGMVVPLGILPFVLMSPQAAQEAFDNPQTFHNNFFVDRCGPVLRFARENEYYKTRVLDLFEEFVERHLFKSVK